VVFSRRIYTTHRRNQARVGAKLEFSRSQAGVLIVIHKSGQAKKTRHFGRDAEIQAMDGNVPIVQVFDLDGLPARGFTSLDIQTLVAALCCHPWTLDFGIPAEMTGLQLLCMTMRAGTWEPA